MFFMVISLKKHYAAEKKSLNKCIEEYPIRMKETKQIIKIINNKFTFKTNFKILEIGAAQGLFVITMNQLGYKCEGIEPYEGAIKVSKELSEKFNININIKKGFAEDIPFENGSFDVVIATSVMEHVKDVKKVLNEVYRILKPNGCFYFSTSSSLCPIQHEIRFFPFFSWYPINIKRKIMRWAVKNKPSLVGYTDAPAINWFTPWYTYRLLKQEGFKRIYDRWDFEIASERDLKMKKIFLKIIRLNILTKILANIIFSGSSYIAIKEDS